MHTKNLPDTTDLIKTELQQLQAALRSSQKQIQWQVHRPMSHAEIEKRIGNLKLGAGISTLVEIGIAVYFSLFVFHDDAFIRNLFIGIIGLMVATNPFVIRIVERNLRQNRVDKTALLLDLDKQKVIVNEGPRRQRHLKFHSKHTLPAFVLPYNANDDLRRLRDDVQNRLTQITGLHFA